MKMIVFTDELFFETFSKRLCRARFFTKKTHLVHQFVKHRFRKNNNYHNNFGKKFQSLIKN